jgi:diguanylate cyclase (GGDEF)-like protein/PAS domain S-box-containing protein
MDKIKDNLVSENNPPLLDEIYSSDEMSEFVFNALMATETDTIYIKDTLGRLIMVNQKFVNKMERFGENEVIGKTNNELFGIEFGSETQKEEQHLYETGEPIASAIEVRTASPNERYYTHTTKIPLKNREGDIIGLIGFTREIDELKSRETTLQALATHDELTNVYNRHGLFERLNELKQQTGNKMAVLVIDIDNLKQINDHYFHKAGDQFLKWFAWILKTTTRGNDIVARIGGDEFVLILEDIQNNVDVTSFCTKLYRNFNQSIDARFQALGVGMSIGISMYPSDSSDPVQLIELADKALYWAKNHHKGEFQFFNLLSTNQPAIGAGGKTGK